MKHTKGTWHARGSFNDQPCISTEETGKTIALCYSLGQPDGYSLGKPNRETTEAEANAKLIAAAPELLKACEKVLSSINTNCITEQLHIDDAELLSEIMADIYRAIDKAKGGS